MVELSFETEIHSSADTVFQLITDLRGYDRWLTSSAAYAGTTEISADPITAGTTYTESSPSGTRHGTVTELDPPNRVTFHQPMTMKPRSLGTIDIHVTYTLTPTPAGVHVARLVTLTLPWPLKPLQPFVLRQFRQESQRTIQALKSFTETQP
ncbi:MAG TPA: SRPBCC domain-containing protein [Actinophytocola sp.]|jgi:uncharacterized protein YndB with AHSA1/START domain|uniref:SRPBCC family protein n=1 Tax=Actinophytocola sp. TaxID=1872138 RepID=UPI002DF742BC|nr:SRPBCC domain-containing protein [Actinophytocola sp.]